MARRQTVLVLGATGGIGGEVMRQLRDAGWDVRAMKRSRVPSTQRASIRSTQCASPDADERRDEGADERADGVSWVRGDATIRQDVIAAARGCTVIVHAVNPPGYRNWAQLGLPMLDNTIAAAAAEGATIVFPGNVYNFGPDAFPVLAEDSAQRPLTRKGAIRVEMERRLRAATGRGARVLVVRAGDFFGPKALGNWFSQGFVQPGKAVKTVRDPGLPGTGHQWSYLPDVARTIVELLARRDTLAAFSVFHMAGHWDADGSQMAAAIRRVVARRTGIEPRVRAFPWWLLRLASPFVATFRELREMRYLWREPVRMDNARLVATLGREPHTPFDEAVEATLEGLGCIAG